MSALNELRVMGIEVKSKSGRTLHLVGLNRLPRRLVEKAVELARNHKEDILDDLAATPEANFHWVLIDGKWVKVPDDGRSLWEQHRDLTGVVCLDIKKDCASDDAFEAFLKRYSMKKRTLH